MGSVRVLISVLAVPLAALTAAVAPPAQALERVDTSALLQAVSVNGILGHERALQRIADRNEGTRASGTPGFAASVDYVRAQLTAAGYEVAEQKFTFPFFRDLAKPTLRTVTPQAKELTTETFTYSGSGQVTGRLVPIDLLLPPAEVPSSTSGCEASDFPPASTTAPEVALIQRGTCTFAIKVANAVAAGYDAVVIFNEGQPGRQELFSGTLGGPVDIPVLAVSFADGSALAEQAQQGPVTVALTASTENKPDAVTSNLIADTPGGDPNQVIVVGAHLDSVTDGPGINDNGSGTSTVLEIARQLSRLHLEPLRKVRFAFFGAEENGLLGSEHYVAGLSDDELATIYANLNFDMLASPNYSRFVYDGDGSSGADATVGPPGSGAIEQLFTDYYAAQDLPVEPSPFDGRSDYGPFIEAGIPAGGLDAGAEGIKSAEEAARYGGKAGVAYDVCYHKACDTLTNLNTRALAELGDGAAHAVLTLADSPQGLYEDGSLLAARPLVARPQLRLPRPGTL